MTANPLPLKGVRVLERANGVAAAYAGRMLATLGAETIMLETQIGSELRREPPFLTDRLSATFAYLSVGKRSVVCDLARPDQREEFTRLLRSSTVFIDDTPVAVRTQEEIDFHALKPDLIYVSVLPFGAQGPKASWKGEEINLIHASGEGYLLPNGLTLERFPERPPLKMFGNFMSYQAGVAAAAGALAALLTAPGLKGQIVDISVQDISVALGAMTLQRLGDGVLEHRATRSFRYGGVFPCVDGHVEILTAEERQWDGLVKLLGHPKWSEDPSLSDASERARRGEEINAEIRLWAHDKCAADLVDLGQKLGVPIARFREPREILNGDHERVRGLFAPVSFPGVGTLATLMAPLHLNGAAFPSPAPPPELGADQHLLCGAEISPRELAA